MWWYAYRIDEVERLFVDALLEYALQCDRVFVSIQDAIFRHEGRCLRRAKGQSEVTTIKRLLIQHNMMNAEGLNLRRFTPIQSTTHIVPFKNAMGPFLFDQHQIRNNAPRFTWSRHCMANSKRDRRCSRIMESVIHRIALQKSKSHNGGLRML